MRGRKRPSNTAVTPFNVLTEMEKREGAAPELQRSLPNADQSRQRNPKVGGITARWEAAPASKTVARNDGSSYDPHASTCGDLCRGMATGGLVPVVGLFDLLRAADEILHDVCLQTLHVVFASTGALWAPTPDAPRGVRLPIAFDPNLVIMAPQDDEIQHMLRPTSSRRADLVALPDRRGWASKDDSLRSLRAARGALRRGRDIAISHRHTVLPALRAATILPMGIDPRRHNARFVNRWIKHYARCLGKSPTSYGGGSCVAGGW